MMKKNFQEWHTRKEFLHAEKQRPFFHEGEVWFCSLGVNVGFEQDGRGEEFLRPIVVVKKFNQEVCWGIPITKSCKQGQHYFPFQLNEKLSTAILSQIRLIDGKRLQYKIGNVAHDDLQQMKKRLAQFLV